MYFGFILLTTLLLSNGIYARAGSHLHESGTHSESRKSYSSVSFKYKII